MFNFFFVGGEATKKPPPPIRTENPSPHLEKKVAKRNPHGEKVAIATPLRAPMGGGQLQE